MKKTMVLYGNTQIPRIYCGFCKTTSFVIDGIIQCCDRKIDECNFSIKTKRISEVWQRRKRPNRESINKMLVLQDNKCIYCQIAFGSFYQHPKSDKIKQTKACCDHVVPYSYSQNNKSINFVLACEICNGIKSDLMFNTTEEARDYVARRREKKGFKDEIYLC